jgi:LEA14-like dessication related protein
MGKGLGLIIVGGAGLIAYNLYGKAQTAKRLDVSLADVSIDSKHITLTNTPINLKVSLYNPTGNPIRFEKFTGNVYLNGKRVTDIDPKPFSKLIILKPREENIIPLTIKIKNSMLALDIFDRIVDVLRNKTKLTLSGTVKIIGAIKAEGLTVPINFDYDLSSL